MPGSIQRAGRSATVAMLGTAVACLMACTGRVATTPPATSPRTEPAVDEEPSPAETTPPSVTAAADPDAAALRASALAAASAAGLKPRAPRAGSRQGRPQSGLQRVGSWKDARGGAAGSAKQVDWAANYFTVLPWAQVEPDGGLVLSWQTRTRAPAAATFMGLRVEEDPYARPRYRRYEMESRGTPGRTHQVRGDLSRLLKPKYDVNAIVERGYGEVAWQVEQFEPETGSTVLYEGRTSFRLAPKAEAGTGVEMVQLPTVVLGPFVHQLQGDRFVVSFETDVPTAASVAVGGRTPTVSATPGKRHEIVVDGLRPDTNYRYQVAVSDGVETSVAPPRDVHTRAGSGPVRIAILSDSRSGVGPGLEAHNGVNAAVLERLMALAHRRGVEAVFFPGDMIDGYATHPDDFDHQLRTWLKVVEGIGGSIPIYTGMGNHEVLIDQWNDGVALAKTGADSAESHFAALMVNPAGAPAPARDGAPPYDETVYSVDLGDVHLVMLNTNYWYGSHPGHPRYEGKGNREGYLMDGQLAWLEADLTAARKGGAKHIVVMGHEPAFPIGGHVKDAMWWKNEVGVVNAMRERFWTMLAEHGVLAYVSGDEHNYSRALIGAETVSGAKRSVYSVISGGTGAPYYAATPPKEYAAQLQTFSAQQHVTLWTFEPGKAPQLEVVGLSGSVVEAVVLDEAGLP